MKAKLTTLALAGALAVVIIIAVALAAVVQGDSSSAVTSRANLHRQIAVREHAIQLWKSERMGKLSRRVGRAAAISKFCASFYPQMEASSYYKSWATKNKGERDKWIQYRTAICAPQTPASPALVTSFGKALVVVGEMALDGVAPPPPGDTTPPAVSFTAPASGATVSGTAVNVAADASDNVGVTSVQFAVDGVNIGPADMAAPYVVSWDTTTSTNAVHTLTAIAKDAANNSTQASRPVTVSNSGPPPPPPPGVPPPIAGQGYIKTFGDEFSNATLDSTVWNDKQFWEEPRPSAITLAGGIVSIVNQPSWGQDDVSIQTGPYWGTEPSKKTWEFGYFEARMRFTNAKGSWPAFWLLSEAHASWANWPACPEPDLNFELDIMEYQGDELNRFYGTEHRNTGDVCGTPSGNSRSVITNVANLAGNWHTFAVKWTASTLTWYVDDIQQGSPQALFDSGDQNMFIALTAQACGWDSTNSCDASTPAQLKTEVDWVHVWQQ